MSSVPPLAYRPPPGSTVEAGGDKDPGPPAWPPWSAPVALLSGLGVSLFGYVVIAAVAGTIRAHDQPPGVQIGATVLQDLALIASAVFFAGLVRRPRPWQFGLRRTPVRAAAGRAALVAIGVLVFSAIWTALLAPHTKDDLVKELGANRSDSSFVAFTLLVVVVAPIAEELFFRGYFFRALARWKGPWVSAVITGLVFGAVHVAGTPIVFLAPLALLGFGLCWLYWRTGSLYPCIALHSLNNALALGAGQHWLWWQVLALMGGAVTAVMAITLPLSGGVRPRPA